MTRIDTPETLSGVVDSDPIRGAAMKALASEGLPTKKTESWRFTDVRALATSDFEVSDPEVGVGPLPEGVSFEVTDGAPPLRPARHFAALNTVLYTSAHRIAARGSSPDPVVLTYQGADNATHPRLLVEVAANARLTLVERFVGHGRFTNQVVEIVLAEGARCDHVRVHEDTGHLIATVEVNQAKSSQYTSHVVSLGGTLTRLDLNVALMGEGAECSLRGAFHTQGKDHVDHHVRVEHIAPRATSHQEYRGLLDGKSTAVFDGQSIVRRTAPGSEAHQLSRNLLLSRSANVYTKPHLEIDHDDVVASHGATVGALDDDQVFYLRSRGIPERESRALLTFAFVRAIVDSLPVETLRDELIEKIEARLESANESARETIG